MEKDKNVGARDIIRQVCPNVKGQGDNDDLVTWRAVTYGPSAPKRRVKSHNKSHKAPGGTAMVHTERVGMWRPRADSNG